MGAVLTLATLTRQRPFALRVLVEAGLNTPVEWVHVSELTDPTPFLRSGTLLLTTGLQLGLPEVYVARLRESGAVGLGFGVGLSHTSVPDSLIEACVAAGMPLLEVPLATRFADIVKFVADDLARTAVRAARSTVDIERALIRALGAQDVPGEIATRLSKWLGGWAMVLDEETTLVAVAPAKARRELRTVRAELGRISPAGRFSASWSVDGTQISVHPIERGYLAVGTPNLPKDGHSVIGIAVNLLSFQAEQAAHTQRTLGEAAVRLLINGFPEDATHLAKLPTPPVRIAILQDTNAPNHLCVADKEGLLCVVETDLEPLKRLIGDRGRAAVSDPVALEDVPGAVVQARDLVSTLTGPGIVTRTDVTGLLSYVDTPAVRGYIKLLLAPIQDPMLLETLRVFLACDGSWAAASASLNIHRHTLRYRIRKVEELLGKRLDHTGTRAELWLALQLDN
jgi:purine catabolism regulator